MRAAKKIDVERKREGEVQYPKLERMSELQILHYASRRATGSARHQNRVITSWPNEYPLLMHPLFYIATNPMVLLSTGKCWAMLQFTRITSFSPALSFKKPKKVAAK